jgi:3-mercaptopyruvate sulfurtransferase SseA
VIESAIAGAGLTYEDTLLVYETTALPGRAYVLLEYAGFGGRIHVLDGGINAWNGELSKSPVSVTPGSFRMTRKSDPRVDMAYVASKIGAIDATIIDGREESAYADGHIPTARTLPQSSLMTAQGRLKPIDEVVRLFQRAGVDGTKQVVSYCGSGVYGASNFLAMRNLGYKNIVFYDPSWDEWSREPNAKQEISLANYNFGVAPSGTGKASPRFVDRKELQAAIDDNRKTVVIVDVRSPADYDWGHIPTSVNVFWNDTVDANRSLLAAEELRAVYAKAGLSPSKRVIIYARGGFQLTHTYTVLSMLGYRNVDFFSGKFEGWRAK